MSFVFGAVPQSQLLLPLVHPVVQEVQDSVSVPERTTRLAYYVAVMTHLCIFDVIGAVTANIQCEQTGPVEEALLLLCRLRLPDEIWSADQEREFLRSVPLFKKKPKAGRSITIAVGAVNASAALIADSTGRAATSITLILYLTEASSLCYGSQFSIRR